MSDGDRSSQRTRPLHAVLLLCGSLTVTVLAIELVLRASLREEEANGNYWGFGVFEAFPPTGYRHAEGFDGIAFRRDVFEAPVRIGR